jgi:hypothetical protein
MRSMWAADLDEGALQDVRGADALSVLEWEVQVGDERVEVVAKTGAEAGIRPLVVGGQRGERARGFARCGSVVERRPVAGP